MRIVSAGIGFVVVLLLAAPSAFAYGGGGGGGADDITAMVPTKPPQSTTVPAGFIPIPFDSIPIDTVFVDPETSDMESAPKAGIITVSEFGDEGLIVVGGEWTPAGETAQWVVITTGGILVGVATGGSSILVQAVAAGTYSGLTAYGTGGTGSDAAYSGTKDAVIALIPVDPVSQAGISLVVDEAVERPAQTIKAVVLDPFFPPKARDFVRTGAEVLAEHPEILRDAAIRAVVPGIAYSPPGSSE